MIVQPCTHLHLHLHLHSSPCRPFPPRLTLTAPPPATTRISCSVSQARGYGGTVDHEKKPPFRWVSVCKKITLLAKENPHLGSATVLNQWELQNKPLTKSDVSRIVKELRKCNFLHQALEVYDWMSTQEERFIFSSSDSAIHLDLIARVRGTPSAENFFHQLPENLKDNKIYGALLNGYVRDKKREEAESLFEEMRVKGYATSPLPFNVMMTLYMKLKDYAKVESMVSEMMEKNIRLDPYSYNIWISCCGSQGSAEKMEQAFQQMKLDKMYYPNWSTFSTMATMYIKFGQLEKAEECLKKLEGRIQSREPLPYQYLLSLYGSIGKKDEVLRVWNTYKSAFPTIPNRAYNCLISSLIKVGDVGEAEKMYEEWRAGKRYNDARIGNLLMTTYVKEGNFEKVEDFFERMVREGRIPSSTWEILAEGRIGQRKIPEALSCLREYYALRGSKRWRLKRANVYAFTKLCEEEGDAESKEVLLELLKQYESEKEGSENDESEEDTDSIG